MVKYNYWFFNWIYVLECLYFMEWVMTETLESINDYYNSRYKLAKDLSHDMLVIVDCGI